MKLLLIEDEKRMADALAELLRQEKYDVDTFCDGIQGLDALLSDIYDVVVLDVMLPGKNGYEIVREARRSGVLTPILMLTAKSDLDDKVTGLDSGADDYLTKPFMVKELLARLRALCRRSVPVNNGNLVFEDLSLNQNTAILSCTKRGLEVRLSEKEYRLLEYFIANAGQIITREQLALKVWGYENNAEYNNVEVYISFTRKKLNFLQSDVEIKAIRGLGYELRSKNV